MGIVQDVNSRNQRNDRFASIIMFLAFGAIMALAFIGLAKSGDYTCNVSTVVVQPGDTLVEIAQDNCSGDWRSVVDDMARDCSLIRPGEVVNLPS